MPSGSSTIAAITNAENSTDTPSAPTGQLVGYARASTLDQKASIESQERDLEAAGCHKSFSESVSSVDTEERHQLWAAMDYLREGDVLVVTKLDRLARSTADLSRLVEQLHQKGAALRVLDINLDTSTSTGRLMLNLLGSIAQFEREIMLERQREGIERARREGKYRGRKPTARQKSDEVLRLKRDGYGATEIAKKVGIGRASVYRILNEALASED
jgi:DNA invertase Pin-like site-specific DNA recombinase